MPGRARRARLPADPRGRAAAADDVGCAVLDHEALALLKAHGAAVDGERARFGEELVAQALEQCAGAVHRGRSPAGARPARGARRSARAGQRLRAALRARRRRAASQHAGRPADVDRPRSPLSQHRRARLQRGTDRRARGPPGAGERARARHRQRQGCAAHRRHPGGAEGGHRRRGDPLRCAMARTAAAVDHHQQHVAPAALRRGGPGPDAAGAARPAHLLLGLRHGRHHRPAHPGRPPRRAARRAAVRPRAHAAGQARLPLPLRRDLLDLVHAEWRPDAGSTRVLDAHGRDRAARALAWAAGARRRLAHRLPRPRRPGRHRVGPRDQDGPRPRRGVRAARRRHPLVLQLLLSGEVRDRRRGPERSSHRRVGPSSRTRRRWPST